MGIVGLLKKRKTKLQGDGLSIETAFRETVLPSNVSNDYNRYLTPLHGVEGVDWSVKNEEFVPIGERHSFYNLVTIELSNGEARKYYFNKSANFCVLYADELEARRKAREEYENLSWYKKLLDLFNQSFY